uniref:Uncharacterized protein n=1 Tax=Rhizophora mucronata TaxID=61149 RepID=A0A2P2N5D1_RHIMU
MHDFQTLKLKITASHDSNLIKLCIVALKLN